MRADAVDARTVTDPAVYEQSIQLAREIAYVLRRNVVQAIKVTDSASQGEEQDRWSEWSSPEDSNLLMIPCAYYRAANYKGYGTRIE